MSEGVIAMTTHALPNTHVDLVSYSAYDTRDDPEQLARALDVIVEHTNDSEHFGNRNVYLGEFGQPENKFVDDKETFLRRVHETIDVARVKRCPYAIYWQLYYNEPVASAAGEAVVGNGDVNGFFLIRPEGSRAWVWDVRKDALLIVLQRKNRQCEEPRSTKISSAAKRLKNQRGSASKEELKPEANTTTAGDISTMALTLNY